MAWSLRCRGARFWCPKSIGCRNEEGGPTLVAVGPLSGYEIESVSSVSDRTSLIKCDRDSLER